MRYFFSLIGFFFIFNSYSCGNEYGHELSGRRMYTEFFYLSDGIRKLDKEQVQNYLNEALAKRGQSEDDFKNESNIAFHYMRLGNVKKALEILKPLAVEYPNEYTILANLGTAYELNGELTKALQYIKKGYEINPDSHLGSEWIHIKILEAKIKQKSNPSWLDTHSIISVEELKEKSTNSHSELPRPIYGDPHSNQLALQIRTRVPFTPAPNKVISNLLKTLAEYSEEYETVENALMAHIYRLEFESSPSKILTIKADLKKLIEKIRSSESNSLSESFMYLVKIGEVDPELLIHAIDPVEFELQKADLERITNMDSVEAMKTKVDSLEQIIDKRSKRVSIQTAGENGFFWGMLFGTFGLIAGIIIATVSRRRKK